MDDETRINWLYIATGTLGGIALGFGLGALATRGVTVRGVLWVGLGVVLLWWAFSARRKASPGTPESERDGSHTVE